MNDCLDDKTLSGLKDCGALKEALLASVPEKGRIQCNMCQHRCSIAEGGVGRCHTVINSRNKLYTTIYGVISSSAVDPIEKKPVFHYQPGSKCFSVGTLGCNFRCVFCQNYEIAYSSALDSYENCRIGVSPEAIVQSAKRADCQGVAWTYNEPSIWLNYTLDCARLCKEAGLYTAYVTNGYSTPEALDLIGPYLDIYRVDIKSTEAHYHDKLTHITKIDGIMEVAQRAKRKWNMHVEVVTNIIPGWNDSDENLTETAKWIANGVGDDTPWHITRFFPYGELDDIPSTPISTLERAVQIGKRAGLKFVYLGNTRTSDGENTYCPKCGALNVERTGYKTKLKAITLDGRCSIDNEPLNILM